jgi:hypothetical protein
MFEKRVLKIKFGPKRDDVKEEWMNLTNIIAIIETSRVRWAGRLVRVGEMRNAHKILVEKI